MISQTEAQLRQLRIITGKLKLKQHTATCVHTPPRGHGAMGAWPPPFSTYWQHQLRPANSSWLTAHSRGARRAGSGRPTRDLTVGSGSKALWDHLICSWNLKEHHYAPK